MTTDYLSHEWSTEAACAGAPTAIFFEEAWDEETNRPIPAGDAKAKQYCKRCPVVNPCLEAALAIGESYGIWGGMNPAERSKLMKIRKAKGVKRT